MPISARMERVTHSPRLHVATVDDSSPAEDELELSESA